jgi:phosphonate degradation associated HDIG domain protein
MTVPHVLTLQRLADLRELLQRRGGECYDGEPVGHLEHALQCAALAQRAAASPALVVAALLHDIGHLTSGLPGTPSAEGVDDGHELAGAAWMSRWLPRAVCEPVRLHVQAKRYLAREPAWRRVLSADSLRSLALQGGPMDEAQAQAFAALPGSRDAVRLRHWDEAAKRPGMATPTLDELWPVVERLAAGR